MSEQNTSTKIAQIAIIGAPNVGKSSILNNWLDTKVSIVSSKPHTTRNNILGAVTKNDTQLVFVDTPGFARKSGFWWKHLSDALKSALREVDGVLLVVDALKPLKYGTEILLDLMLKSDKPCFITVHKCDAVKKPDLFKVAQLLNDKGYNDEIFLTSSNNGLGMDVLLNKMMSLAKKGEWFFLDGEKTNLSKEWIAAEYVREKAFYLLHQEIPFHLAVVPIKSDFSGEKWNMYVKIIVHQLTHKKIVIGKKGTMLREIGSSARAELVAKMGPGSLFIEVEVDKDFKKKAPTIYQ